MAKKAMTTMGMSPGQIAAATIANAVRVFNAGSMALRPVGISIGELYKAEIDKKYKQPGTGKVYKDLRAPGGMYTASAPGEAPAVRTGRLAAGTKYAVYRKPGHAAATGQFVKSFGKTEIVIYNKVSYAHELEFGTRGKGKKIAARPAWRPVSATWQAGGGARIKGRIMFAQPMNFIKAEIQAASALVMAFPGTTLGREMAAGR